MAKWLGITDYQANVINQINLLYIARNGGADETGLVENIESAIDDLFDLYDRLDVPRLLG